MIISLFRAYLIATILLFSLTAILTISPADAQVSDAAASGAGAVTLDDVLTLLSIGSKTEEIVPELTKRGFSGPADADTLKKIKQAGGDVSLLLAVKKAAGSAGASPAPMAPPASQPTPQSEPSAASSAPLSVALSAYGLLPKSCDQWDEVTNDAGKGGYFKFRKGKSWGLVDRSGKIVLKAEYAERELLLWWVWGDKEPIAVNVVYWDRAAKRWLMRSMSRQYNPESFRWDGVAFEATTPRLLSEKIDWLGDPQQFTSPAWYQERGSNKYGFVAISGDIVIPARWDKVTDFEWSDLPERTHPGLYNFAIEDEFNKSIPDIYLGFWKYGPFIGERNKHSKNINPPERNATALAFVSTGGKWGAIDLAGREVMPTTYDKLEAIGVLYPRKLIKASVGDMRGLFDLEGNMLLPMSYLDIQPEGRFVFLCKEIPAQPGATKIVCELFDSETNMLIKEAVADTPFANPYASISKTTVFLLGKGGKNRFFDGMQWIDVPWIEMKHANKNSGLIKVAQMTREGKRWGFAWPDGTVAIQPRWKHVSDFYDAGVAYVSNDDDDMKILEKRGSIYPGDGPGPNAFAPEVQTAAESAAMEELLMAEAKAKAERDTGHYGLINYRGKLLCDMNLTAICDWADLEIADVKMNGRWGTIDTSGHFTPDP